MKLYKFKSIRSQLTYWFLLLSLLPIIVALFITYFQRVQNIEKAAYDKLTAIRDLKVQEVNRWLEERVGDLHVMAGDYEIRSLENIFNKESSSEPNRVKITNATELFKRNMLNYKVYSELFFIDASTGLVEISTKKEFEGSNVSHNDYFTKPIETGDVYIKDIYRSHETNNNEMTFSIPVFCMTHNEHIVGVLVGRIDLESSLFAILKNTVGLGETGETLIVNADGLALNDLRWRENATLNLKISAEPAMNASKGNTGIIKSNDYRNIKVLAAYTYIAQTGWGFVCKQDMYEINAPIRSMVMHFVLLFFFCGIVILIVVIIISRSISQPIRDMNTVARKIGSGDYSARNIIGLENELGNLALEFNHMAEITESKIMVQQGVVDISETMIGRTDMQGFGNSLLKRLLKITNANMAAFYILNEVTDQYEYFSSIGANEEMLSPFSASNPQGEFGNVLSAKKIMHLRNIDENTVFRFKTVAGEAIPKEIVTIPIMVENNVFAIISLVNINKFKQNSIDILNQSWTSINTSYSNLIASERTRVLAEHLSRMNQQLEAQTEELQEQSEELQNQTEELQKTSDELQEQNIELEQQRKQVEAANKLKSEFLSNMSHELRTPLNSIMALSRVLIMQAKDKLDADENNYLEIVERNGKRLLTLINDILDLSKIEAGKIDVQPEFISIVPLLRTLKENLYQMCEDKGLEFNINLPEHVPQIETDEGRLYQVLLNIAGNAVKFTEKGIISVNLSNDDKNVFVNIADTGIGISEEELPFIFDEFRQADGTSSRKFEGTGLGLAIAKKMMNVLGGTIEAKSVLGKGSVFTVTVPLKWSEDILLEETAYTSDIGTHSDEKLILVVDDDPKTVKVISDHLKEEGYKTISTHSGKEALKLAENYQPYAITLDIFMEDMDGWEVLQKLKANNITKNIPVVIVSVSDDQATGLALGATAFINKPVSKDLLISQIKKINKLPGSVMIVDDDELELKQLAEIVESENIEVYLAKDGRECLSLLNEHIPDVLLLDLIMPELDGFTVLDKIRHQERTKNIPVIIITAKDLTKKDRLKLSGNISSLISKSEANPRILLNELQRVMKEIEQRKGVELKKVNHLADRILLVEDNPDAIIQLRSVLESENYLVNVAENGKEALDYIKHTIPDGIILDLMMPGVDGFEVLEKLRGSEATSLIPVLVLTAKDLTKKDLNRLSSNNIQQLIQKGDVNIEQLLYKVKLMLESQAGFKLKDKNEKYKDAGFDRRSMSKQAPVDRSKQKNKNDKKGLANILVVEDNADNMTTIKAILKGKYHVLEATDGEQGLEMAQSEVPDVILLDMSLPKMDGNELIKRLKSNAGTGKIPIIAVTALAMKGDKEKILNSGCDAYVAKPIDGAELLNEIMKLISK